jgi:HK97 gp10 family phage protein
MIKIKVLGAEEIEKSFAESSKVIVGKLNEAIRKSTEVIKQNISRRAPVFEGTLKRSIKAQTFNLKGEVGIAPASEKYGYVQEYGRRAGSRMPPVNALKPWARIKLGDEDLAFPLARSIARKGTKPQPFFEPGFKESISDVEGYLKEAGSKIISEI